MTSRSRRHCGGQIPRLQCGRGVSRVNGAATRRLHRNVSGPGSVTVGNTMMTRGIDFIACSFSSRLKFAPPSRSRNGLKFLHFPVSLFLFLSAESDTTLFHPILAVQTLTRYRLCWERTSSAGRRREPPSAFLDAHAHLQQTPHGRVSGAKHDKFRINPSKIKMTTTTGKRNKRVFFSVSSVRSWYTRGEEVNGLATAT